MDGEFIHAITKAALSGEVCHRCGHAWHSDSCVNVAPAAKPAQPGWLRAIDEALVMHDVGVANADDDYATAKDKLNKLLCVVQDIGAYFAKQESAQSAAEPVSKRWDSLSSIGNRLHNISVEQHYAGNEKLSDELGEFASLLWIWERTRKPTVPPAIVEPAQAVPEGYRLQSIAELDAMNEWIYSNDDLTIAYMSGRNDQKAVDHYNKQKALDFVRWIAQLKTGGLIQARANDILRILEKWK